jgi:mRNA degradation ribonuclease J1/J2
MKLSVEYISFSAHADYSHTAEYIKMLQPPNIVLVHGDANEMKKLQNDLISRYNKDKIKVLTPKNCQPVRLKLISKKSAKIIGKLAKNTLRGILERRQHFEAMEIERPLPKAIEQDVMMIDTTQQEGLQAKVSKEDLSNYVTVDGIFVK